jgi:hypothetical protein
VFSIESVFFLREYWNDHDQARREEIRNLVNGGRLCLTGSALTTPDTILPDTEAIIRDYLYGQEWLRENGMTVEPRLAYLPDNFGNSPMLPAILGSLGCDRAAITRIDGMYFMGADYRPKSAFPLRGSSAAELERHHGANDFVWRSPDGSEILTHWNAHTYFQGDMLATSGIIRWMGVTFGISRRGEKHVARRIERFVRELKPLARTPYLFCPIGCDFNGPIPGLVELLARYNEHRYPATGVWAVNASLDDYLDLVDCHRHALPVVTLDPNPYWMGFYGSRPAAKLRCNRITSKAILAEKVSATQPASSAVERELREAWEILALTNHHDLITGTAPDRVWKSEQLEWLDEAERLADSALCEAGARVRRWERGGPGATEPPEWRLHNGRLEIRTPHYRVEIDQHHGGCIMSFADSGGHEMLDGPANDLVGYADSGGLWRMGHEFLGGEFREIRKSSRLDAEVKATECEDELFVEVSSHLMLRPFVRRLWFSTSSPIVRMQVVGAAAKQHTVTCRFPTKLSAAGLTMDVPGGIVERPLRKIYDPTFWPARTFAHVACKTGRAGLAAFLGGPACISARPDGTIEWLAARNAQLERAFGVLPVPAHPARGRSNEAHCLDYAVWFTHSAEGLAREGRRVLHESWVDRESHHLQEIADSVVSTDRRDVAVGAVKRACRGEGLIARLHNHGPRASVIRVRCEGGARPIRAARICDARERDLGPVHIDGGEAVVPISRAITSVRLFV